VAFKDRDTAGFAATSDVSPLNVDAAYRPLRAWGILVILMTLQVLSLLDRNILSLMIIEVRKDLGLTDFQVSLLQGLAFSAFYCTFGLFIGALVDRYPARRIIYISVTVWSLAATAAGFVRTFWGMMFARMLTGAGEGGVTPASQVMIATLFPKNRVSLPMSLFSVCGAIGIGLSYAGGGLLLDALTARSLPALGALAPWRQVLIVTAVPGLLLAFLSLFVPNNRPAHAASGAPQTWREFIRFFIAERNLYGRLICGYALLTVVTYAISSWAPTYGRRVLRLSASEVGTEIGMIMTVLSVFSGGLYGYVVDRQSSRGTADFVLRATVFGIVVAIPVTALGFVLDQHPAFTAALIAAQVAMMSALGPAVAALLIVTPVEMRGRMAALKLVAINLVGFAAGPMIVGAFTDFLFADPQKVGLSIALTIVLLGPLAAWCIWSVRPYFVARLTGSQPQH
jgi:MFS family permease